MKYYEDFPEGFVYEYQVPGLSAEEIVAFAEQYDPQRFHLSEEEAKKTHFGGLVASGFQTQLHCFVTLCRDVFVDAEAVGAPGIDSLRWLRPWYPGETLDAAATLLEKRQSSKRTDRGYLRFRLTAAADGKPTLEMEWSVIIMTRPEAE